jgi:hypothetical protein
VSEALGKRREIRTLFGKACAIVHGRGSGMSVNELMELVYEEGLPPRAEREQILEAKLAGDNTTADS